MSTAMRNAQHANMTIDDRERLLDVSEAAALLHVKGKTLYAWVSRNKIPYRKLGSLVRFHRGELIEWAKGPHQDRQSRGRPRLLTVVEEDRFFGRLLEGAANENSTLEAGRER